MRFLISASFTSNRNILGYANLPVNKECPVDPTFRPSK